VRSAVGWGAEVQMKYDEVKRVAQLIIYGLVIALGIFMFVYTDSGAVKMLFAIPTMLSVIQLWRFLKPSSKV
jgi:hypothetical protein